NELYQESKLVAGAGTQAVAALVQADQSKFVDCAFTSYHDTLYAQLGRQYYENCFIEGRTDYIFGYNATAYFKNCNIHTLGAGVTEKNGGYIVATKGLNKNASTDAIKYGYIFDGCTLDADDKTMDGSVSIARGWDVKMAVMVMNSNISKAYSKAAYGSDNGGVNTRYGKMNAAPVAELLLEYNNEGDGAIQASLANSCTVVENAADYADFAKIFGATNGLLTYDSAWNPVAVKDATVVLKDSEGNVLATLSNVAFAGAAIAKDDVVPFVNIPDGSIIEGFYSNQSCTAAYDFTTALVSGENSIYVKFTSTATLSNMTIKFENLPASIEKEYAIEGTVVTLVGSSSKKISVDTSGKAIKDADGNDYTAAQRVKTGGATDSTGRYIKIDLTAYEGQAKIQVYTQTGTSAESRTGQLRKDSVTGTSLKVIDCPSGGAATLNEVVVDCGSVYYITADASINFYGINILPQSGSQQTPPTGTDDTVAHKSEFSWTAISTSLLNPVGTYSYDLEGNEATPVDKYDGSSLTNAVLAGTDNAFIHIIDNAVVTYRDGVKWWDAAKSKTTTNPKVMEIKGEALTVTFTGTGTLTIGAASTGGSNDSSIGVKDSTGSVVEAATASTDGYYVVHGTSETLLTFNITAPGTYTIWTNTTDYNRATRISSLVVVDNYAEAK
ncbi:MAG: hypothetical protein K2K15_05905, partial [Anaeroplasmataceae bacterium]|nr:hypothetical protein [Anaeroplasmataceae bacterium]